MKITVNRFKPSDKSTHGIICIDGRAAYVGLEPSNPIPVGTYQVVKYKSPTKGYDVLLLVNVPGHSLVEWHIGNFPTDTRNCLLPGLYPGPDAIYNSRIAFNEITAKVFPLLDAGKKVYITYTNLY